MAARPTRLAVQSRRGTITVRRAPLSSRRPSPITHDVATLVFLTRGTAVLEQRRRRWQVSAGVAVIVPAAEPHRWIEARDADCWQLTFCVPCLQAEGASALELVSAARGERSPIFPIPEERRAFLSTLLGDLEARTTASPEVERSFLVLVLDELAATPSGAAAPKPGLVAAALTFIEKNCLRPLTLAEIARAVGRTPAHVTTAIRHATGQSAHAWIVTGRMAEARRLLLHSDASMEGIAEAVGYRDPTHFIRLFKRVHGQTPAAWRSGHSEQPRR